MKFVKYISSAACLEIISADMTRLMNIIAEHGIILRDVQFLSEIRIRTVVSKKDIHRVRLICDRFGCQTDVIRFTGLYWPIKAILKRPVIIAGVFLLFLTALWLPSRILFIQVSGNCNVSDQYILEQAALCGVRFGSKTALVRSERIKNEMLARIPQLQWVGINTNGCVAQIQVKENEQEKQRPVTTSNLSIYAFMDGVVTHAHATKGTLNCKVGQAVSEGDVLIFNFVPNGDVLQFSGASGEIYADTMRKITAVTPMENTKKREVVGKHVNYSVIIGKKEINFHNGSGIYVGSCVKMKEQSTWKLPGGFALPVSVIKETIIFYITDINEAVDIPENFLQDYSSEYLEKQMISGRIISCKYLPSETDALYTLQADFACNELIASITNEG